MTKELVIREIRIEVIMPLKLQSTKILIYSI